MGKETMELAFNIEKCVAWAAGLESEQDWKEWQLGEKPLSDNLNLPALKNIPAMQRRRLSPFAKLSLHCALEASGEHSAHIDAVFSSRHGDLHRTAQLIENIATKEALSPTHFGLSVHNAVAGLFSIYTGNKAPISAVACGEHSFITGLIDTVAKLHSNKLERILYVYSDLIVPDVYKDYVSEQEQSIAIALLIEPAKSDSNTYSIQQQKSKIEIKPLLPSLAFLDYYYAKEKSLSLCLNQQNWLLRRKV